VNVPGSSITISTSSRWISPAGSRERLKMFHEHPTFREGLGMVLATQPDMSLVAQASN
jgi:hypothetical protein